jgi:hypothetical protein
MQVGSDLHPRLAFIIRTLIYDGCRTARRASVCPIITRQLGGRLDYHQGHSVPHELHGRRSLYTFAGKENGSTTR